MRDLREAAVAIHRVDGAVGGDAYEAKERLVGGRARFRREGEHRAAVAGRVDRSEEDAVLEEAVAGEGGVE